MLSEIQNIANYFDGDGSTVEFTLDFYVFRQADVKAFVDGAAETGFTVSNMGTAAPATITFDTAPAAGTGNVAIVLDPAATRDTDYQLNGDFLATQVNRDIDRIWQKLQVMTPQPYVIIDMNSDDYTMTVAEAVCPIKIVSNGVTGKTLTWPSACDTLAPARHLLSLSGSQPGVILASETGGATATTVQSLFTMDAIFLPGLAVLLYQDGTRFIKEVSGTSYEILPSDCGVLLIFTSATAVAVDVPEEVATAGFNVGAIQAGAGQVSLSGTAAIRNVNSHSSTAGQYAKVCLDCYMAGEINLSGETA